MSTPYIVTNIITIPNEYAAQPDRRLPLSLQILAIRIPEGGEVQHITHLLCYRPDTGQIGESTLKDVVAYVDVPANYAYVCDGNGIAGLEAVGTSPRYVRTVRDGSVTDNLMSLPRLP